MSNETATFGGGCFWCVEAVIQKLRGVSKIESGYTGGPAGTVPTYEEVCKGTTGHAEVVQVTFDSEVLSYHDLITVFMTSHDPTTLNRQGGDAGTQYRSVIYYHSDEQKIIIGDVFEETKSFFPGPIVTEVSPTEEFHVAEEYHQDYYTRNSEAGYCRAVISPKIAKLKAMYADKVN